MTKFNRLKDCVVSNKSVIVRVDFNVPIVDGKITDDTRIKACIPTLKYLLENNAKVIVISHFGRPKGQFEESQSLIQIVKHLANLLSPYQVNFGEDCVGQQAQNALEKTQYGQLILLENLRFHNGETKNDEAFSAQLASLGNLYVNDAFSCSHRSHASITGIAQKLKSCAGLLMEKELDNLSNLLENAQKPMMAIVGGAKVSTKIDLLKALVTKAKSIVVAGGMANTFLFAQGHKIGKSLCEKELATNALEIIDLAKKSNCQIILPSQVVVAKEFKKNAEHRTIAIAEIDSEEMILDVGKKSVNEIISQLKDHQTLLWNGPLGAFELEPFNIATTNLAMAIADLTQKGKIISVAGGGDVVSAINSCNMFDKFSYISTAGGAFLEWLEGKDLPGITALKNSSK
ncbi:MAG: phosphoglycerate kinase [Alphaproteobacteria bacterium]